MYIRCNNVKLIKVFGPSSLGLPKINSIEITIARMIQILLFADDLVAGTDWDVDSLGTDKESGYHKELSKTTKMRIYKSDKNREGKRDNTQVTLKQENVLEVVKLNAAAPMIFVLLLLKGNFRTS